MKTLLLLGIILSASVSRAADTAAPANDAAANTSVAANERDAIKQKCHVSEALAKDADPKQSVIALACWQQNRPLLQTAKDIDDSLAALSPAEKQQIIAPCNFTPSTDDAKSLIKKQKCVTDNLSALSKRKAIQAAPEQLIQTLAIADMAIAQPNPLPPPPPPPPPPPEIGAGVSGGETPVFQPPPGAEDSDKDKANPTPTNANANPAGLTDGEHVGSSTYTTPSTCVIKGKGADNGSAQDHPELIGVRRELLAAKEASDVYGRRLGKRYIVYQVRISDYSKDYQYVVHDISLNLKDVLLRQGVPGTYKDGVELPATAFLASSRDLDVLRGIPEKGQDYDPRNLSLHILTGLGSVAGGISGLTPFSDVMGSAVAVFNGAFLQAFVGIAPDHTGTQLNRLSDEAFASNTLVDKLHTKVFAIFIPQSLVLGKDNQKDFWKDPRTLLSTLPLDQVDVCVDGSLVTEVSITPNPAFSVTNADIGAATSVSLKDSGSDAAIYYTEDGTTPSAASPKVENGKPITFKPTDIGTTKTIKAVAISPNKQQSSITIQTYNIQRIPTPDPAPANASKAPVTVTLKLAAAGDKAYYTVNGDTPTNASTRYTTPINIPSSQTLKVIEVPAAGSAGPVATFDYKLK